MTDGSIDWESARRNRTAEWAEQSFVRYETILEVVGAGHAIVPVGLLSKSYLSEDAMKATGYRHRGTSCLIERTEDVERWYAPGAPLHDYNYGIVMAPGVLSVIDVDVRDEGDGSLDFEAIQEQHGFKVPKLGVVGTPSGGFHFYLPHDGVSKGGSRVFGPRVFIDYIASVGGHVARVMGPGSVTPKGPYVVIRPIPSVDLLKSTTLPPELLKLLPKHVASVYNLDSARPKHVARGGRGNENVSEQDQLRKFSIEEAREAVMSIPCPDVSRDDWLRVAMALHYEYSNTDSADEAKELFIEWSATDQARYDRPECEKMWANFSPDPETPITMGTVIKLATDNGFEPKSDTSRNMAIVEEINAKTPNVFICGQSRFVMVADDGSLHIMTKADAKDWYANRRIFIGGKYVNPIDYFMCSDHRIKYEGIGMFPPGSECPPKIYNTWKGYAVVPQPGDITRYLELFDQMFTEPDVREWVHDWFADLVQRPGKKPSTAIVLGGPQGTGKGMLTTMFMDMFPSGNTTQFVHADQFVSMFNMSILRSVLMVINEAVWAGNHKHMNVLKGYIDGEMFEVQDKNVKAFQARNCAHFIIASNEEWRVPVERDGRRFCVVDIPKVLDPFDPWWGETKKILKNKKTVAAVMHWYLNREITHNLVQVPDNEALNKQKRISMAIMSHKHSINCDVAITMLKRAKADELSSGRYWVENNEIKKCFSITTGERSNHMFPSQFVAWLKSVAEQTMGTEFVTELKNSGRYMKSLRRKVDGWPQSGFVMPSVDTLVGMLSRYMLVDPEELDVHDEWGTGREGADF